MSRQSATRIRAAFAIALSAAALAACTANHGRLPVARVKLSDRECLARAMYFESNRSSDAGMLAVGTVVMNRVKSGKYGDTVCEVVGAPRQFAPGVLTRSMSDSGAPRARRVADQVLAGRRHPGVQNAQFFHTAGYKFPYRNMRYVLVAGGNAFYDKTKPPKTWWGGEGRWGPPPAPTERIDGGPIMVAKVEVEDDAGPAPERAARHRATETQVAEARMAAGTPPRGGSYDGIPVYEPAPGARSSREVKVAALEPSRRPRRGFDDAPRPEMIAQDNGLRVEDRWRDQELAADEGRPAATGQDWTERRRDRIEQAALPEIEEPRARQPKPSRLASRDLEVYDPAPAPRTAIEEPAPSRNLRAASRPRPATRMASREPEVYDPAPEPRAEMDEPAPSRSARAASRPQSATRFAARQPDPYDAAPEPRAAMDEPAPSRNVRMAARAPRTVETRQRPVEADPAAMGWSVGAQPVRMERDEPAMDGYRPLSAAAGDAGYQVDAPRRRPSRSYGGVALQEGDSVGFR